MNTPKIQVPDFDDLVALTKKIRELSLKKMQLQFEIRSKEAKTIHIVTNDEKYFVKGRPPSMSYIESTYKWSGIGDELLPLRYEMADVVSQLEEARNLFDVYKNMISLYQTESANKRSSTL